MFWTVLFLIFIAYFIIERYFVRGLKVSTVMDKYVFVTGCDSGFGRKLAIRLDEMGFHVFAGCLTSAGQSYLQQTCSKQLKTCPLDVTKQESIEEALRFVQDQLPSGKGLWAVVNNAGFFGNMLTPEMLKRSDYIETLEVNLLGPIEINRQFLPLVRKEQGRFVNMTSIMGRFPVTVCPYSVSKNGLEAYLDILRKEVYYQNIKVCMIQPGAYATNLLVKLEERMQKTFDTLSDDIKDVYGHDYCKKRTRALDGTVFSSDLGPVVDAYVHALTAKYPRTRYVVGSDARLFFVPMAYLPDWLGDLIYLNVETLAQKCKTTLWELIAMTTGVTKKKMDLD